MPPLSSHIQFMAESLDETGNKGPNVPWGCPGWCHRLTQQHCQTLAAAWASFGWSDPWQPHDLTKICEYDPKILITCFIEKRLVKFASYHSYFDVSLDMVIKLWTYCNYWRHIPQTPLYYHLKRFFQLSPYFDDVLNKVIKSSREKKIPQTSFPLMYVSHLALPSR